MHPQLLGRRRPLGTLKTARPGRGAAALAVLVGIAGVLAVAGAVPSGAGRVSDATASTSPPVAIAAMPGVPVPLPTLGLSEARSTDGRATFRADALAPSDAEALYAYYLSQMPALGWTLVSKGDPDAYGWTSLWRLEERTVLLALVRLPSVRFTIDSCPPEPYC